MSKKLKKILWSQKNLSSSIQNYFDAYMGEFNTGCVESNYPYSGKISEKFRRIAQIEEYEKDFRFEGKGSGCWTLQKDHELNSLTGDLMAYADILGGLIEKKSSSSLSSGIGADSDKLWISFLDGGIGVHILISEHEYTNRVYAKQKTTIRGPMAFRTLCCFLGFEWSNLKFTERKENQKKKK
jgi:hypothetical protein